WPPRRRRARRRDRACASTRGADRPRPETRSGDSRECACALARTSTRTGGLPPPRPARRCGSRSQSKTETPRTSLASPPAVAARSAQRQLERRRLALLEHHGHPKLLEVLLERLAAELDRVRAEEVLDVALPLGAHERRHALVHSPI